MNCVRLVQENGVPNIQKKLWYVDDNSEISLVNFEAGDRIYSINDDELYQVEYDTSTQQEYSGEIVSFEADEDDRISSLEVKINPIQDLHGYDNPWPAGGGKNILPLFANEEKNGITLVNNNGVITLNGTASSDTYFDLFFTDEIIEGQTFSLCGFNPVAATNRLTIFIIADNGNPQLNLNNINAIYHTTSGSSGTISRARLRVPADLKLENFILAPMLQIGGEAPTKFEPYENKCPISGWIRAEISHSRADTSNPTVIPISWQTEAGTVHGGTLNVTTGVLTVDMVTYQPLSSYTPTGITSIGTYTRCAYSSSTVRPSYSASTPINGVYSHGFYSSEWTGNNSHGYVNDSAVAYFWFPCEATEAAIQAYLLSQEQAGTPVTLCYKISNPFTVQLDPVTVNLLLGENNIWVDTGDTIIIVINNKTLFKLNPHS